MEDSVWGDFGKTEFGSFSTPIAGMTGINETTNSALTSSDSEKAQIIKDSLLNLPSESVIELDNKLSTSKKAWIELVRLITDEDRGDEFTTFKEYLSDIKDVNTKKITGVALIHYIIVYDRSAYIELLIENGKNKVDLNLFDDLVGYSPLMWGFSLQRSDCCTELFNASDKIDFKLTNKDGLSAWDMIVPGSAIYNFLDQNNMFQYRDLIAYMENNTTAAGNLDKTQNPAEQHVFDNIERKIADMKLDTQYGDDNFYNNQKSSNMMMGDENTIGNFNDIETFDFKKLLKYQYLEFENYDIPQILDVLVSLPKKHPHMTTYPAALLYQCARYADQKKKNPTMVESLLKLSFTKIVASVSNSDLYSNNETTASVEETVLEIDNPSNDKEDDSKDRKTKTKSDIVTQSYWIGALTFLFYYFTKDESFFKRHPSILQGLINALHSIMIELVTSIHSRLSPLIQKTLLNYTTIEDVKQTLYKKDWNFFKRRKQAKQMLKEKNRKLQKHLNPNKNSHEEDDNDNESNLSPVASNSNETIASEGVSPYFDKEILRHLYPPSLEEQMKPSPMKIVQIFGALSYVLGLHQIHPLLQQQCLSIAIHWFSTSVFNQILKDKKKKTLSRARAIQIRLNLSALEAWIKNNDLVVEKPKLIDDFMWERYPFTLILELGKINLSQPSLQNITTYKATNNQFITDSSNSLFYYQPFHKISHFHLEPVFQLLQWLQVATTLEDEESLESTMNLLNRLTPAQLLKSIEKYNYEINEHKFNSKLKKKISTLSKELTMTARQTYVEENQIPLLCLPTITELTDTFASERDYLPFLPDDIQDEVFEIHDANHKLRMNDVEFEDILQENNDETDEENQLNTDKEVTPVSAYTENNAGDIFGDINPPTATVARPAWANEEEIVENPW